MKQINKSYTVVLQSQEEKKGGEEGCLEHLSSIELSENGANTDLCETPLGHFKRLSEEKVIVIPCCNKTTCKQFFPKGDDGWIAQPLTI